MPERTTRGAALGLRARQLLVGVVGAVLTGVMVFLGLWQMQVFESQKTQTTQQRAAQPPIPLETNLQQGSSAGTYGRRVTVHGRYTGQQVAVGTAEPMRLVSALRTDGGRTLAVVRGTTAQASLPKPPSGEVTLTGVMLPLEGASTDPVPSTAPKGSLPSLRLDQLAQSWPAPLLDGYLTLDASLQHGDGLGVAPLQIPDTSGGRVRNQGYALQWWAFAIFAAASTVVVIRTMDRRER